MKSMVFLIPRILRKNRSGIIKICFDDCLYIIEELALKIIIHYRVSTPKAIKFISKLGFKQPDIMTKDNQ